MPLGGMAIGAGINGITSLIGGGKQASAIKQAAQEQAQAAEYAANLQAQAEANSLAFTKGVYKNAQGYAAPYQQAGTTALSQLSAGTQPGGVFNSTPTGAQVLAQDPGYAFRLQQGQQALERAEAAGGGVGSGGALKAAQQYGQDFASGEYANAYNRFLNTRQANYANLSGLAGLGAQTNSALMYAGMGAANNVANTSLQGANQQGNYLTQGANAQAAGLIGQANAWNGALSNIGNSAMQLGQMYYYGQQAANQSGYNPNSFAATLGGLPGVNAVEQAVLNSSNNGND